MFIPASRRGWIGVAQPCSRSCHLQSRVTLEQRVGSIRLHKQRRKEMEVEKWLDSVP